MKLAFNLFICLFSCAILGAQETNSDHHATCRAGVRCMAPKKGIELRYENSPFAAFRSKAVEDGSVEREFDTRYRQSVEMKLKAPLVNRPAFKSALGFAYAFERLQVEESSEALPLFVNDWLKALQLTWYTSIPISDKSYISTRFAARFAGNFDGFADFSKRSLSLSGFAVWGFKKNENREIGFGLAYVYKFGFQTALPVFIYNQTFNDQWGIESYLPSRVLVRRNFSERTILKFGAQLKTNSFYVVYADSVSGDSQDYRFKYAEAEYGIEFYQHAGSLIWLLLKAGVRQNIYTKVADYTSARGETRKQYMRAPGLYAGITLFLVPPKK